MEKGREMQCKAKSKRSQEQCKKPAARGREVCNIHGGKTLKGAASGTFKDGRTSKYLITRLQADYEENLKDETLLALVDEISVARAMMQEIMTKGGSYVQWRDVQKAWKAYKAALAGKDRAEIEEAKQELERLIAQGAFDWQNRHELLDGFDQIRKLISSEHRHRIDNRMAITQEDLVTQMAAVAGLIEKHVKDRETFLAIVGGLDELVEGGATSTAGTPSRN